MCLYTCRSGVEYIRPRYYLRLSSYLNKVLTQISKTVYDAVDNSTYSSSGNHCMGRPPILDDMIRQEPEEKIGEPHGRCENGEFQTNHKNASPRPPDCTEVRCEFSLVLRAYPADLMAVRSRRFHDDLSVSWS